VRSAILKQLHKHFADDPSLFFVTADMGLGNVEVFKDSYPDRFLNAGIAEQNAVGICAGLWNVGYRPILYSVGNFLVHRPFEQLRNDIAAQEIPIILIGTTAGYDNASLGPTHHLIDEWGCIKSLPGFEVYTPWSVEYAEQLIDKVLNRHRPTYIRIPKGSPSMSLVKDAPISYLHKADGPLLITYGPLAEECRKVHEAHPEVSVLVMHKHWPITSDYVLGILNNYKRGIVVEDHFKHTGLYGSLCQYVMDNGLRIKLESAAPPHHYELMSAKNPEWYWKKFKLDKAGLERRLGF